MTLTSFEHEADILRKKEKLKSRAASKGKQLNEFEIRSKRSSLKPSHNQKYESDSDSQA